MKIRVVVWTCSMLGLAIVASIGALSTHAAGPEGAPYLDNDAHTLQAHGEMWYKFEFSLDRPGFLCKFIFCPDRASNHGYVEIRMPAMAKSGVQFAVFAPAQIRQWAKEEPVGMGNADGNDLTWASDSDDNARPWYVRVMNDTNGPLTYRFEVTGIGLVLSRSVVPAERPMSPSEQLEQSRRPTVVATPDLTIANTDPSMAVAFDGFTHTIPAQYELWYRFAFPAGAHATLTLLDGAGNGLRLDIYAPDQLKAWWQSDPLGRGAAVGADLLWAGDADGDAVRYLRVVNPTLTALDFRINVDSPGFPRPGPRPFAGFP